MYTLPNGTPREAVVTVYYEDENGNLHPVPPDTKVYVTYIYRLGGEWDEAYTNCYPQVTDRSTVRFYVQYPNREYRIYLVGKAIRRDVSLSKSVMQYIVATRIKYHVFACGRFRVSQDPNTGLYLPTEDIYMPYHHTIQTYLRIPEASTNRYPNYTETLPMLNTLAKVWENLYACGTITHRIAGIYRPNENYSPTGITCEDDDRIYINGQDPNEYSEDRLLQAAGNLILKRYQPNFVQGLRLNPQYPNKTDLNQSWLNGFCYYFSSCLRDNPLVYTINNQWVDVSTITTKGCDDEVAVACCLYQIKDFKDIVKAILQSPQPQHTGYNIADFYKALENINYILLPKVRNIYVDCGLTPKLKMVEKTYTKRPTFIWDKNDILQTDITYKLEIAEDARFNNIIYTQENIASTGTTITQDLEDKKYFFRVTPEVEALLSLPKDYKDFEVYTPKKLGFSYINSPTIVGIPSDGILCLYDKDNNLYEGSYKVKYNGEIKELIEEFPQINVSFHSTDPNAQLPQGFTFQESSVHYLEGLILNTEGTHSITVEGESEGGIILEEAVHEDIKVYPAGQVAHHMHLDMLSEVQPNETCSVTVIVHDANCNLVTNYTGEIAFLSTDPQAKLPETYTFTIQDYGVKFFVDAISFTTPGSQTITCYDTANPNICGTFTINVLGAPPPPPPNATPINPRR
jgi:hypothetical protein